MYVQKGERSNHPIDNTQILLQLRVRANNTRSINVTSECVCFSRVPTTVWFNYAVRSNDHQCNLIRSAFMPLDLCALTWEIHSNSRQSAGSTYSNRCPSGIITFALLPVRSLIQFNRNLRANGHKSTNQLDDNQLEQTTNISPTTLARKLSSLSWCLADTRHKEGGRYRYQHPRRGG